MENGRTGGKLMTWEPRFTSDLSFLAKSLIREMKAQNSGGARSTVRAWAAILQWPEPRHASIGRFGIASGKCVRAMPCC